jgi:FKBP-type peptidyl-prolyl cis-trans isomerase FklB
MDKNSYALGMSIAHNMMSSGIRTISFDDFAAGVKAVLTGSEPAVSFQEAGQLLDKYFAELEAEQKAEAEAMSAAMREEGEAFLKFNAEQEGVVVLPSGLQYKVLSEGAGKKPKATDKVRCHYAGTLLNGVQFDSSYDRGEPAVFGLNQVIAGWTEGVQLMSEGSKYEFFIPYNLAYGEHGAPGAIPPYATLKFVVELLEVLYRQCYLLLIIFHHLVLKVRLIE